MVCAWKIPRLAKANKQHGGNLCFKSLSFNHWTMIVGPCVFPVYVDFGDLNSVPGQEPSYVWHVRSKARSCG